MQGKNGRKWSIGTYSGSDEFYHAYMRYNFGICLNYRSIVGMCRDEILKSYKFQTYESSYLDSLRYHLLSFHTNLKILLSKTNERCRSDHFFLQALFETFRERQSLTE